MPRGLKTAGAVAAIVAVAVVATGTISRASEVSRDRSWAADRAIPTVQLVPVKASAGSDALTLPGTIEAWNTARLFPRVTGYVKAWYHDIGNDIPANTPLGLVDTPELDQQIDQARADLASAKANADLSRSTAARWNDLLSTHSVSQQEADEKNGDLAVKTAAVRGAQAALNRLLAMKGYATVRAPFSGIITLRNAQIGDLVGPTTGAQQPMFAMADISHMRLYVSVPQSYAAQMRPGLTATLHVPDYPAHSYSAKVIGDAGAINSQSGTLQVQLLADNPGHELRPGGYAQVRFDLPGRADDVVIPATSLIFRSAGTQVATVAANGHIEMRPVTVGRDMGSSVEILSGLHAGDRVVDNPSDSLAQGDEVRIGGGDHA
jgi:RND family efflux transporter MFP subunit